MSELTLKDVEESLKKHIDSKVEELESKLDAKIESGEKRLEERVMAAFPNKDAIGHRAFHEKEMNDAAKWDKIKTGLMEKALGGIMMAAAGFLGMAVWSQFVASVSK